MAAKRTIPDTTCETCGALFRKRGRFCSTACWYSWTGRRPERLCQACDRTLTTRQGRAKTCSVECANIVRRTAVRNTTCEACGSPLRANVHSRVRFCSRSCANSGHRNGGVRPVGSTADAGSGYVKVKTPAGWKLQHRHVMEEALGRELEAHERVHHRNGNRADNRPENLELWKVKSKDPAGVRASDYHCPGCRCADAS